VPRFSRRGLQGEGGASWLTGVLQRCRGGLQARARRSADAVVSSAAGVRRELLSAMDPEELHVVALEAFDALYVHIW